ncbi:MAG: hypothetical protein JWQ87_59 [Candidatus Sulfotelmatobacter sp.]|nr:hypothetical protein [Candidatus Sulfotelmatobacter sp.]
MSSLARRLQFVIRRETASQNLSEAFMKKQAQSLWFLSALALFLSVGISLSAQDSTPQTSTPPDAQSQPAPTPQAPQTQEGKPSQTPESQSTPATDQSQPAQAPQSQTPPSQAPDTTAPPASNSQTTAAQPNGVQSFTGTIVKSGDKYMFQDADTGTTYDIDHQDQVQKFEGKKVKVHGTLDAGTKTIHVQ